jgi:hypothetical protein
MASKAKEKSEKMQALGLSAREQGIRQVLEPFSENYLLLLPEIPSERLAAARKACQVPADERVLGLLDLTSEESAEHSLVFGGKGLYYHNPRKSDCPGPGAVRYEEFPSRTFVNHGTQVYLGKDQFLCPEADWCENYPEGCDRIAHLLNAVRRREQQKQRKQRQKLKKKESPGGHCLM